MISPPPSEAQPLLSAPFEEDYQVQEVQKEELQRASPTDVGDSKMSSNQMRAMGGAAVIGGIAGMILVGPIVGLAAAGGAAALATSKGKAGDVTRATGNVVADAGARLKKIDQKHHVSAKAAKGVVKSANWVSKKLKPKS
mmetsp:Transcript_10918/g.14450  ORF Transcript_10918/g.14450 Transcript_10918/m.14450 type:complete len:140 (-) Transcript_10918:184-603(-)|eukprot:CAMPEP_0198148278 /NCGR_PEP_ID=MMETSP1443-20131203/40825_1 /TAXON_ID=186043 /ORGANISM="Entomoneis sp., Strain CCMP2396" /LENGTH=139 /DNA_ID=CAMNT_0043812931 /DNA_START=71 /DNA_END=490 /DNA_ORIENTATION=+